MSSLKNLALLALSTGMASIAAAQASGSGTTTRYWDCCKGSCAWPGKADVSAPITTCDIKDQPLTDANAASGCDGGTAYMCSDQSPWAVNATMAYGFAAVSIPSETESDWCCSCYELTFTSTSIAGKKMIVQATNTGGDLAQGQFDLAIPGGGVGIFNGCTDEWGAPASGWGAQYGGISSNTCSSFPSALQPGCNFRFGDFFEGADNPTVDYKQVTCPKALTDKTGCVRSGETPTGGDEGSSSSAAAPASSATSAAASSYSAPASSSSSEAAPVTSSSSSAAYSAPASSSSQAAPVASSSSSAAYSAPASSSSSEAAPVASSSTATASPPAYSAPASSSSSEAAPAQSSSASAVSSPTYTSRPYYPTGASSGFPVAPVGTAGSSGYPAPSGGVPAPSGYAPGAPAGGDECEVQYVYED